MPFYCLETQIFTNFLILSHLSISKIFLMYFSFPNNASISFSIITVSGFGIPITKAMFRSPRDSNPDFFLDLLIVTKFREYFSLRPMSINL